MGTRHAPLTARFDEQYIPEPMCGCWLWTGSLQKDGYGLIKDGRMRTAHRVSWELHRGPIPARACVLHKCDVRSCVNPDHLWLGSLRDNAVDMARKKRTGGQKVGIGAVPGIRVDRRPLAVVGADHGISIAQVSRIRNRRRFEHVD